MYFLIINVRNLGVGRAMLSLKALEENHFHAFSLASGVAGNQSLMFLGI